MDRFMVEMTATGGTMILAIGLNRLGFTKIRVANLFPAIIIVTFLVVIEYYGGIFSPFNKEYPRGEQTPFGYF